MADASIYPLLAELSACLCNALHEDDATAGCFCGVLLGDAIPVEYAGDCDECGVAYVRLVSSFPSTDAFPAEDSRATCRGLVAYVIAVGVARCVSIGDNRGNLPDPQEVEESVRRALRDMDLIRKAVQCCLSGSFDDEYEHVAGAYTPMDEAGFIGGEQLLTVRRVF